MLAGKVAKSFSKLLHRELGPTKMAVVIERNRRETSRGVCHSHDFCDANMVMMEAMREHGLMQHGTATEDDETDVWNEAWDMAKKAEFVVKGAK